MTEIVQPIPARLKNVAVNGHVAGASDIIDDTLNKTQDVINGEVAEDISDLQEAVGQGGSVDTRIKNAINALDATKSQNAGADGLALSITETDGKITSISGSIAPNTYAPASDSARITSLETAVGSGGSVDSRIAAAKSEIKGNATSACDTLGEAEALITAETNRAQTREGQIFDLVHTPEQHYVTVATYADLANIASPSDDTVYRVSNYDGGQSQVNNAVYSEYAYDGTNFVLLCVKSQIDEVYDISAAHSNNTYVDLAAALDGGNNIPQELQRGGMSVKFVQSSDNKYVQYRLMANEFTTDTTQWAIADDSVYVENPEFVYVKTDAEGKILWAIKNDGGIYYGAGCPQQVKDYIEEKIAELSLDEYEDIVAFLSDYLGSDTTLKVMIDSINERIPEIIESPEFLEVTTDSEDKVIEGIQVDGTKVIGGDIRVLGNMEVSGVSYKVIENPEYLAAWVDAEDKVIFGLKTDGKTYIGDADFLNDIEDIKAFIQNTTDKNINWDALSSITAVENPEFIEAKTDSEGKIISYRDSDGVKHENIGIETDNVTVNHLNLTEAGMTEFQQALKDSGFNPGGKGDWSDYLSDDGNNPLSIPMPRCAMMNLTNSTNDAVWPQAKNLDLEYTVQFWDMQGNYFKKKVFANAQGNSSLGMPKKNLALDFFDSDWDDDAFSIKFGNWVPQDSFHIKAYYADYFVGVCSISYKLFDQIIATRNIYENRDWKKFFIPSKETIGINCRALASLDDKYTLDNDARCFPDGFPVICYLNGTFYGVFSWQLKKHRDNYQMSKKKQKHIHLDGILDPVSIFAANGNLNWDIISGVIALNGARDGIEIRNPKPKKKKDGWDLTCADGSTYDGDNNRQELIGTDNTVGSYAIYVLALPPNFEGCTLTIGIEEDTYSIVVPSDATIGSILTQINSIDYSSHGYSTRIEHDIRVVFTDTESRGNDIPVVTLTKSGADTRPAIGAVLYTVIYDSTNDSHKKSADTKKALIDLSTYLPELEQMEEDSATTEAIRAKLADYFDIQSFIDYLIFGDVTGNFDGFRKNWQWITYDGVKWYIEPYDLDGIFGWSGWGDISPEQDLYGRSKTLPTGWIAEYYSTELQARYKELRDAGIITTENILKIFKEWISAIGTDNLQKNHDLWPNDREHYYAAPVETHVDSIYRVSNWLDRRFVKCDTEYNY